jgi:hypothetical protein
LSEKRDVENCREPSLRNGGRVRRRNRFQFELLRELGHIRAARDDCLSAFVSFNPSYGQSDDKSGFTGFRLDLDLTAVPVSYDALAYREAETFPKPTPFVVKKGSKMCEKFPGGMPGPLSRISTTV